MSNTRKLFESYNRYLNEESENLEEIKLEIKKHEDAIEDIKNEWEEYIEKAKQSESVGEAF